MFITRIPCTKQQNAKFYSKQDQVHLVHDG